MERHLIRAGTTVHVGGIPLRLLYDVLIETADGNMALTGLVRRETAPGPEATMVRPLEPLLVGGAS